jgi:hypothetical protein
MTRTALVILLIAGLGFSQQPSVAGQFDQADAGLATGIRQVREGEFDGALTTLDGVVKRLSAQKGPSKELARAYTYLGIAYVGLAQQEKARASFLEAWRADKAFTPSPKEYPPNIIELFERAKKEGELAAKAQAAVPAPAASPAHPAPVAATARSGSSNLALYLLGGAAVAGGGIAIAAKGSSGPSPTQPTPTPTPLRPTVTPSSYSVTLAADRNAGATAFDVSGPGNLTLRVTINPPLRCITIFCFGVGVLGSNCLNPNVDDAFRDGAIITIPNVASGRYSLWFVDCEGDPKKRTPMTVTVDLTID